MPASIIDGRALADELRVELRARSLRLRERGIVPRLTVVIVGEDAASMAYVASLKSVGSGLGIDVNVAALRANADNAMLSAELVRLGDDDAVHGIIVQQPLPIQLSIRAVADTMPASKDVDGANPINQGRLAFGSGTPFVPATPAAVMLLLERSPAWPLWGRDVVVVGRSNVVGLPVSLLLMAQNATVSVTHKETHDLTRFTRSAEVLVVAAGAPGLIVGQNVRPGATVIDVGTTFVDGKLVGDVDFSSVAAVASAITPVPGGVGPVTNVALMRNVLDAAERASELGRIIS